MRPILRFQARLSGWCSQSFLPESGDSPTPCRDAYIDRPPTMRIAIISDILGNLTALDAVLADLRQHKPEVIYHGGDVPYGGSHPAEVIDCVVQEGWKGVLGNTDEMLWDSSARPALEASAPKLKP